MHTYTHAQHMHIHIYTHTHTHTQHRSVEKLDLDEGRWVHVEPMLSRRSTLGVAVLNGQLYAVGGFDGTNGLDTVEAYNPGNYSRSSSSIAV